MELNEIWDEIVNNGIATEEELQLATEEELQLVTEEELQLVTGINGYNEESLNDVIYYKTGYRDIEQYLED